MSSCIGERSCASSTITCPYDRAAPLDERTRLVEQRQVVLAPAQLRHARAAGRATAASARRPRARLGRLRERRRRGEQAARRASRRAAAAARGRDTSRRKPLRRSARSSSSKLLQRARAEQLAVALVEAAEHRHAEPLPRERRARAGRRAPLEQARARRAPSPSTKYAVDAAARAPREPGRHRELDRASHDLAQAAGRP